MRAFVRGMGVVCAVVMIGNMAATAMAQQVPVRVVQGTDGTVYVIQGGNSWTLVPDPISDADTAALSPGGEIDGVLPDALFAAAPPPVQAAPPVAAQPPAPAPPPPAPVVPAAEPTLITGTVDLTGKVSNSVDNPTPIAIGATITSIVDIHTKPHDIYSINFTAGVKYTMTSSSNNKYGGPAVTVNVLNPDHTVATQLFPGGYYSTGCTTISNAPCIFTPAVSGTYYLDATPQGVTQNYTFTVKQG
jgi:hypothetical protein